MVATTVVTGAAGHVGSAVVGHLERTGHAVLAVDRTAIDLATSPILPLIRDRDVSGIVHLASRVPGSDVPDSKEQAVLIRAIDRNVSDASESLGVLVVYASSCGVYTDRTLGPIAESAPTGGSSPYFAAKLAGERLFQLSSTVLRLSSPVGPTAASETVLSRFVTSAMNERRITVWGTGSREQDFVDVDDLAELVRLALARGAGVGVLNAASGSPVTMLELAEIVRGELPESRIECGSVVDPQDGALARFDIDKARRSLGWAPQCSIRSTVGRVVRAAKAAR